MLSRKFQLFLYSHGANAFAFGIHVVLLSWLAVGKLGVSSTELGWLQASSLLPNLLFMLLAGVLADRYDSAKILVAAYAVISLSYAYLAFLSITHALSYSTLLVYAALIGAGNAFAQPVREKLITNIENLSVQQRFSFASIVQFSLQSAGIIVAAFSDTLGINIVIVMQALFAFSSMISIAFLRQSQNSKKKYQQSISSAAIEGFSNVMSSNNLRQLMLLIGFNGYMHMGVFLVALPVVARDVYGFSTIEWGSLQLVFVLGMITAHYGMLRKKTIIYPGQGALFSLLYTAIIGFALAKQPLVSGLYLIVYCWGLVAGNSAAHCRLVLQYCSEARVRGRLMSIYQFVLFGFAPLGALVTGYVINHLTIQSIFHVMSLSSIALFVFFFVWGSLWSVKVDKS